MSLDGALGSATSGLDSIERQLAIVSQNVANANTPNYVREKLPLSSVETAAGPAGVRTGAAQRQMDLSLQANVFAATGKQSASTTTSTALDAIDQVSGSPGSGQDLASKLGALRDSLSSLTTNPSDGSQQLDVLDKADAVVGNVHTLASSIVQARQSAQDTLQTDVTTANNALTALGKLSQQIVAAKAAGQSVAGLEDQRDGQMQSLAQLTGARFNPQSNGDMQVIAGNTVLPTTGDAAPFSLAKVNFDGATPASSVPSLMMDGSPVASLGGEMGAQLTLRDTTLPAMQSQLDSFAQSTALQFAGQGLSLFTDASGNVPTSTTQGFSSTIQVSAAVRATPSMLRDGTGPAKQSGDSSLVQGVLDNAFGDGATGLQAQATSVVTTYASMAAQAKADTTTNDALVSGLQSRLSSETGVSVDDELSKMVQLQSAYAANARVVTATQTMWTQLLGMVQ